MTRVSAGRLAVLALYLFAAPVSATVINWDIDSTQSSFKLAIPDQPVTLGTVNATMRLRNQNNATWTTNNAPVDGLLATDIGPGVSSIQFLGGSSSLVGVNTGTYRPNPAAFNSAVTDATNTAGTFTNTTGGAAVYAALVNALAIINIQVGFISFSNVTYDLNSLVTAIVGTSFASNAVTVGILDSQVGFDSTSGLTGLGDALGPSGPISAVNTGAGAGSVTLVSGNTYKLTIPINMPVALSLSGVNLNATATGTLVGFADILPIPEPTTLALMAMGIAGLALHGRRRRSH